MKKINSIIISIIGVLLLALSFYFLKTQTAPAGIMKTLPYLFIGIGCGLLGHGVGGGVSQWSLKKDPALAKQLAIDQKDERNIMLSNISKAKAYDIMTFVFAALLLAYALMGASFEVIIPFVAAYLFVQCYAVYIRIKKEKEI